MRPFCIKSICSFAIIALLTSTPAFGKEGTESFEDLILMEGIQVVASPIENEEVDLEATHKTVLEGEGLENRFASVSEVLSETVGLSINRFGGLGDFSAISIRGSSSEQVLVYLDGFLMNGAQGGGADLARIPLSQIEAIEIYRGSAPIAFGQSGIGGIVHIRTKAATLENGSSTRGRSRELAYQVQYGSFNTSRLNTTYTGKLGKLGKTSLLIGLNQERSDNDFEFLDDKGTQFNPTDDRIVKRKNSRFESLNLLTKIGRSFGEKNRLSLDYHFLDTEKGVPGLGSFQSEQAAFNTQAHRARVGFEGDAVSEGPLNLKLALLYATKNEAFQDRLGEIGIANQDNENKTDAAEARLNADRPIGGFQTFNALLQFRQERFRPFDRLLATQTSTSRRKTLSIGLEDRIALFQKRLYLSPGLLYDDIDNRFQGDTFLSGIGQPSPTHHEDRFLSRRIGFLVQLSPPLSLRANIGRYFRAPNFFELFGDRGGTLGNPELRVEAGLNRDIGLHYRRRAKGLVRTLNLQAAYFHNVVDDQILFVQTSQRTSRAENIGRAETIGQELAGKIELGSHLRLDANYTHQRAVNKSDIPSQRGKILPGRPVHALSGKAELYSARGALFYRYDYTAENFLDRVNQRVAAARHIHNLGFSIKGQSAWTLSLEVKNLSDNRIEDVFGFPLPGRAYFITLEGRI